LKVSRDPELRSLFFQKYSELPQNIQPLTEMLNSRLRLA
jgi:hypothetical protein